MSLEKIEYILHNGIFSSPKKLTITPNYIEFQISNSLGDSSVRVSKAQFQDVKYLVEPIQAEMFHIGSRFIIDILYNDTKVLPIRFAQYFLKKRVYEKTYGEVSALIGKHFLIEKINETLNAFDAGGSLEMPGLKITVDKIIFESTQHEIAWKDLGLKEYYRYFAIFDKKNPNIHKRVTFYEWNAEVLYNTIRSILRGKAQSDLE